MFEITRKQAMKIFATRTLRKHAGKLIRRAEEGRLSVVTKHGTPLFVAVPFDAGLLREDVAKALAVRLFDDEHLSLGKAARMAGLSVGQMIDTLCHQGVPVIRTTRDELARSLTEFG